MDRKHWFKDDKAWQEAMAAYDAAVANSPVPYTSMMVDTRYGNTHILIGGKEENPPLLLFHGWNGSAAGVGGEFPFVFDHFRVYMPDVIGHSGKSAPTRPPTKGATFANWLADLLDGLGLDQVLVMGVSGGGWLTIKTAAFLSDRTHAAIPINPAGTTRFFHPKFLWAARGLAYGTLEGGYIFARGISYGTDSDLVIDGFAKGVHASLGKFKTQGAPPYIPDDELHQIHCPILFILGDKDIFFPRRAAARIRRQIPHAELAILPNTGHLLLTEQVSAAAEIITNFLHSHTEVFP